MNPAPIATSHASYRAFGITLAITGVVCFSLRPILIKFAYAYVVDPINLLALRMTFRCRSSSSRRHGRDATVSARRYSRYN